MKCMRPQIDKINKRNDPYDLCSGMRNQCTLKHVFIELLLVDAAIAGDQGRSHTDLTVSRDLVRTFGTF